MDTMTTAVDRAYRDLSPLDVRIQTHRRYSEAAHDVEADVLTAAAITAAGPPRPRSAQLSCDFPPRMLTAGGRAAHPERDPLARATYLGWLAPLVGRGPKWRRVMI